MVQHDSFEDFVRKLDLALGPLYKWKSNCGNGDHYVSTQLLRRAFHVEQKKVHVLVTTFYVMGPYTFAQSHNRLIIANNAMRHMIKVEIFIL